MMSKTDKKKNSGKRGVSVRVDKDEKTEKESVRVNSYYAKNDTQHKKKADKAKKELEKKKNAKKTAAKTSTSEKTTSKKAAKKTTRGVATIKSETKKPASFSASSKSSKSEKVGAKKVARTEKKTGVKADEKAGIEKAETERVVDKTAVKKTNEKKIDEKKVDEKTENVKETAKKTEVEAEKVEKVTEEKAEDEKSEKIEERAEAAEVAETSQAFSSEKESKITDDAEKPQALSSEEKSIETEEKDTFETLSINSNLAERESKIIKRDVAKEIPEVEEAGDKLAEALEQKSTKESSVESVKITENAEKPQALPSKEKSTESPAISIEMPREATSASRPSARPTAKEIKEREIERAVKSATRLPSSSKRRRGSRFSSGNFGWTRTVLAVACAATAVFAIVYFVNLTSTDMSLKVAAMQSGIEASYPDYVPRGYSLSDVTSTSGKVKMTFKSEDGVYGITEESSTWDSEGLLNNYIRDKYGEDYTVVREQGLTLYMGDSWEAWVNGGIVYKLTVNSGSLTKKQMKTIATSL